MSDGLRPPDPRAPGPFGPGARPPGSATGGGAEMAVSMLGRCLTGTCVPVGHLTEDAADGWRVKDASRRLPPVACGHP